jgi:hypothetical protein
MMEKEAEDVAEVAQDIENPSEKELAPPLTFRRCMAFLALTCLLAISTAPIFFITGALCIPHLR